MYSIIILNSLSQFIIVNLRVFQASGNIYRTSVKKNVAEMGLWMVQAVLFTHCWRLMHQLTYRDKRAVYHTELSLLGPKCSSITGALWIPALMVSLPDRVGAGFVGGKMKNK